MKQQHDDSQVAPSLPGKASDAASYDALDHYLAQQLKRLKVPGAALAIVEGDQIVHQRGFGQARPAVRYLVGQLAKDAGVLGMAFARIVQLEPLAPDSPWKAVPIP